jgi:hypothetical protein
VIHADAKLRRKPRSVLKDAKKNVALLKQRNKLLLAIFSESLSIGEAFFIPVNLVSFHLPVFVRVWSIKYRSRTHMTSVQRLALFIGQGISN